MINKIINFFKAKFGKKEKERIKSDLGKIYDEVLLKECENLKAIKMENPLGQAILWKKYSPLFYKPIRTIDADELLKRIEEKCKQSTNLDVINGLCGATAIIYDMLIETGQEEIKE